MPRDSIPASIFKLFRSPGPLPKQLKVCNYHNLRRLTPFGLRVFRGLDRECVLKLSFYKNMRFWEVFGGSLSDRFGINRCTESKCLKTGPRLD